MNEAQTKQRIRFRVFSLRTFMIVIALLACVFALFAYQFQRFRKNNGAITSIRDAGASVFVMDSHGSSMETTEVSPPGLMSVLASQPPTATLVDMSDSALKAEDIRKIVPHLQMLIPADSYQVLLDVSGNPNVTYDLVEEMRGSLPNCQFVQFTPVPKGTHNAVRIGMSKELLIETVGTLIYDQRNDWPSEKEPTVKMLGSQLNVKYTNGNGNETWTYFTDDAGVGVLGVDFDANQNVIHVWADRGIPQGRQLTEIEVMVGGL